MAEQFLTSLFYCYYSCTNQSHTALEIFLNAPFMTQSPVNTGQSCWGSRWLLVTAGSPPPGTLPRVTRDTCYSTHPALTWTWIVMGVAGGDGSRDFLTLLLFIFS